MKNKFITAVLVLSIGFSGILTSSAYAEEQSSSEAGEQDAYPDMGDSEEEQAYRAFLQNGDEFPDIKYMKEVMYTVCDINQDGKKELILRVQMSGADKYDCILYGYGGQKVENIGYVKNGILTGKGVAEENWDKMENNLAGNPLYKVEIKYNTQFTKEQVYTLKKNLEIPDEEKIAEMRVTDPWYWEENGQWLADVSMWDEEGICLASASIDPDTLEPETNQVFYDAEKVSEDREKAQGTNADTENEVEDVTGTSEEPDQYANYNAVEIVDNLKGMSYAGGQTYEVSLQKGSSGMALTTAIDSGILAAFFMDFDGDGQKEIFGVSCENSAQAGVGRTLHFMLLKNDGVSWNIISEQEVISDSPVGTVYRNCFDGNCVKEEDTVFLRNYNGSYEFFYEEYDEGMMATGQEWFFKGFRLENGALNPIEETSDLYYTGAPIDDYWNNADGTAGTALGNFTALGFASPRVSFGNMTANSNSGLYMILHMTRNATCSMEEINQWLGSGSQNPLGGITCTVEDKTAEIPETLEVFQPAATSTHVHEEGSNVATGYVMPDVTTRYISEDEIADLSLNDIQLIINEMFARHGRVFKTASVAAYFQAKSWYQPDPSKSDEQILAEFNAYERANEEMLEKRRNQLS